MQMLRPSSSLMRIEYQDVGSRRMQAFEGAQMMLGGVALAVAGNDGTLHIRQQADDTPGMQAVSVNLLSDGIRTI